MVVLSFGIQLQPQVGCPVLVWIDGGVAMPFSLECHPWELLNAECIWTGSGADLPESGTPLAQSKQTNKQMNTRCKSRQCWPQRCPVRLWWQVLLQSACQVEISLKMWFEIHPTLLFVSKLSTVINISLVGFWTCFGPSSVNVIEHDHCKWVYSSRLMNLEIHWKWMDYETIFSNQPQKF